MPYGAIQIRFIKSIKLHTSNGVMGRQYRELPTLHPMVSTVKRWTSRVVLWMNGPHAMVRALDPRRCHTMVGGAFGIPKTRVGDESGQKVVDPARRASIEHSRFLSLLIINFTKLRFNWGFVKTYLHCFKINYNRFFLLYKMIVVNKVPKPHKKLKTESCFRTKNV